LINSYINLKRAGENYKANCPFHQEKTPSFVVSPRKQIFHCFGCHSGGNVFSFLMQYDGINFIEAVKKLSHEAGIDVERYLSSDSNESSERGQMFALNQSAADAYHQQLMINKTALSYFNQRKITTDTLKQFKVGYAPDEWEFLTKQIPVNDRNLAIQIGLIINANNRTYDRFRQRIMFPIYSSSKQVLGFGGRRLNDSQNPKYLNSPESEIYNKRHILFGLSHGIDAIRKSNSCIITEGYMDVMRCHQHGIKNVVATSGTALTESHARLLSRYCKTVYLMFDSDNAGLEAAERSIAILLKQNLDIQVVPMPKGADPDTILLKYGAERFQDYLNKSKNFIDFQYRLHEKRGDLTSQSGRAELVHRISEQISRVTDDVLRQLYTQQAEQRFKLKLKTIAAEQEEVQGNDASNELIKAMEAMNQAKYSQEKQLIGLILNLEPEYSQQIIKKLDPDFFKNKFFRRFAIHLIDEFKNERRIDINHLLKKDNKNILNAFVSEMSLRDYGDPQQQINDVILLLKKSEIQRKIDELSASDSSDRIQKIEQLLHEKNKLVSKQ
ncbi:MAG: DNA primase, partial [Calditrichaeota bacterium]|nr:DNA primase [Calditrichota bacterium]